MRRKRRKIKIQREEKRFETKHTNFKLRQYEKHVFTLAWAKFEWLILRLLHLSLPTQPEEYNKITDNDDGDDDCDDDDAESDGSGAYIVQNSTINNTRSTQPATTRGYTQCMRDHDIPSIQASTNGTTSTTARKISLYVY